MTERRRAYTVGIVISLWIVALYFGIRLLDASCVSVFAHADPPATTRAEVALLMSEARTLYDQQKYNSSRDAPLPMPVKVTVSMRAIFGTRSSGTKFTAAIIAAHPVCI